MALNLMVISICFVCWLVLFAGFLYLLASFICWFLVFTGLLLVCHWCRLCLVGVFVERGGGIVYSNLSPSGRITYTCDRRAGLFDTHSLGQPSRLLLHPVVHHRRVLEV